MATTWTPPESVHLSSADITNISDGLFDLDHRAAAFAFLETVPNAGLIYVVACEMAYRTHSERPADAQASRESHLRWIGGRI